MFLAIALCKMLTALLSLFGRGSSLPGSIALKLCPNLLAKMKLPPLIVAVTGSNGKTSTTEYVTELAKKTKKTVISNYQGSNQIDGIVTLFAKHSNLSGRVKADIAVIESDERFCQYTFRYFSPQYILVTNLYRDQMTRNGHNEYVFDQLKKGLPITSTLILNADDPLSAAFAFDRDDTIFFGIDEDVFPGSYNPSVCSDRDFCPVCSSPLRYSSHLIYHLGRYHCSSCNYSRPETTHSVSSLIADKVVIDGLYDIKPQMLNCMFAANTAAAFTIGVEVFALPEEVVEATLNGYILKNDRMKRFDIDGHKGMFLLSKHENTMAYNMSIRTIIESRSNAKTVVVIFDLLSRKYIANDISWLWDIDFELLNNPKVKLIILSGAFASDLATRLSFAGIERQQIRIMPDIRNMTDSLSEIATGEIFVMTCFTDQKKFLGRIKEEV